MKKLKLFPFLLMLFFVPLLTHASVYVKGYFKKNGTYVNGYYKSNPNKTKSDNYSTKGNVNPYTNVAGEKPISPTYYYPICPTAISTRLTELLSESEKLQLDIQNRIKPIQDQINDIESKEKTWACSDYSIDGDVQQKCNLSLVSKSKLLLQQNTILGDWNVGLYKIRLEWDNLKTYPGC